MIQRAFRYRLYPTREQERCLSQIVGVTRFVYNLALEQRRDWWRQYRANTGGALNYASQGRQLTELRQDVDWIREAPAKPLHQALRDLDRAFDAFFSGRAGFPSPRRRGVNDSFRYQFDEVALRTINDRWAEVGIPKTGRVRFRQTRPIEGRIINVTVSREAIGWFVSFSCAIERTIVPTALPDVGIDRGVANTLALSTGEMLSTTSLSHLERRKKRAQRILARRRRGSNRYRKQRAQLSRITARIARCRADWRHKATRNIAERFGRVVLEDLATARMTRAGKGKRGLNRSILEQGWSGFALVLQYKLEERGGTLVKINPAFTSQACSACGAIDKASRESQASFACRHCGFTAHADTNAAINILRRGTAPMRVEDAGCGSDETRPDHALAA